MVRVQPPHAYDGIGQALRSVYRDVYRDNRDPYDPIFNALRQLNRID